MLFNFKMQILRISLFVLTIVLCTASFAHPQSEKKYIGKTVIAGINLRDKNNNIVFSYQITGKIIKVNSNGIFLRIQDTNKEFSLPPNLTALKVAMRGIYNLKNGDVKSIENPDYTIIYDVHQTKNNYMSCF